MRTLSVEHTNSLQLGSACAKQTCYRKSVHILFSLTEVIESKVSGKKNLGATHLPTDSTCLESQEAPQIRSVKARLNSVAKIISVVTPTASAPPAVKGAAGRAEEPDATKKCAVEKRLESAISGMRHGRVKRNGRLSAGWRSGGRVGGVLPARQGVGERALLPHAASLHGRCLRETRARRARSDSTFKKVASKISPNPRACRATCTTPSVKALYSCKQYVCDR